jgi:hypothetical protein
MNMNRYLTLRYEKYEIRKKKKNMCYLLIFFHTNSGTALYPDLMSLCFIPA